MRKWNSQGLITELEKGLGSLMRRKDPSHHRSSSGGQEDDFDALASILTPIDETQYWADVANATKKKEERDKAGAFWNTLQPVAEEFQKISTMQLPGSIMYMPLPWLHLSGPMLVERKVWSCFMIFAL